MAYENLQRPIIRDQIEALLAEKNPEGLSAIPEAWQQTRAALRATDDAGQVDHRVRLTAAAQVYKLAGAYEQPQSPLTVNNTQVNVFASEPIPVLAFMREHSRLPSPAERAALLALPAAADDCAP